MWVKDLFELCEISFIWLLYFIIGIGIVNIGYLVWKLDWFDYLMLFFYI